MKTMLARADAVKKETVVEPEETIMISDKTGISKADAVQYGAQTFFVWRRMDPDKTFRGLLDEDALDRFFETVTISVSRIIEYLMSDVKFIQFLIKKEYVLNYDIILAKVMIDKIARSIIWFSETITEEEEHSSNKPEQSDIHTADSDCDPFDQRNDAEQSDNQTVGHLDCDPAEQQCSSPVLFEATHINTENSEDRNAEERSDANSDSYSNRRLLLHNQFKTWLMGFPYLARDTTSSQHVRQAMVNQENIPKDGRKDIT
ncbi:Hypothetical predicted protein [Mytilus galloprovincialis]|uniref:Uncharacterized protein n=1 Tax=Mytilus galloprovincialis TaxID=29158 RepID=A0A8B6HLS8_MYTGA|nr:Hypothetical predicted protein [Mytilus galloprovincialis]